MTELKFRKSNDCVEWLRAIGVPDPELATKIVIIITPAALVAAEVTYLVDPLAAPAPLEVIK